MLGEDGQRRRLGERTERLGFDLTAMVGKPCGEVADAALLAGQPGVALDEVPPIVGDGVAELAVVGERGILLPALCQASQATLLPSGCSQTAGEPEVCSSTRSRVGCRSETRPTSWRHAVPISGRSDGIGEQGYSVLAGLLERLSQAQPDRQPS
jgi:hypothetical protein